VRAALRPRRARAGSRSPRPRARRPSRSMVPAVGERFAPGGTETPKHSAPICRRH
jgi:hypothetical protein